MTRDELRKAMIERFRQLVRVNSNATEDIEAAACELVDNALAMMPDRAGEFPVGGLDESGRLVTYERRFTVRVAPLSKARPPLMNTFDSICSSASSTLARKTLLA